MGITDDRNDPDLGYGSNDEPVPMNKKYLVLSEDERKLGFVRPYRATYTHIKCGHTTTMNRAIAETYARQPSFYGATYCVHCSKHRPLSEFTWLDGSQVGS